MDEQDEKVYVDTQMIAFFLHGIIEADQAAFSALQTYVEARNRTMRNVQRLGNYLAQQTGMGTVSMRSDVVSGRVSLANVIGNPFAEQGTLPYRLWGCR